MAEYDGISYFLKAAPRRLRDAEELMQPPSLAPYESDAKTRHLRSAVYLAGYVVECMMKAYIISRQPPAVSLAQALEIRRSKGETIPDLLGAVGHNLSTLLSLTDIEALLENDKARRADWNVCLKWKSTWRYDPTPPTREFATEFVEAARRIYQWIERMM